MEIKKIKLLPLHLIDQIKAGEVVERPAALLKELIENSIDAKATQIDLILSDNGIDLISVNDNGWGMSFDDLPLAFTRHATSKIQSYEDLFKLQTHGFRGEALASMSAVSRVTCLSYPRESIDCGGKIVLSGGKTEQHLKVKGPSQGTTIIIKNLFYNTPARFKFLKSKTSEKIAITKVINSYLLAWPEISFSVKWGESGEKSLYPSIGKDLFYERIKQIWKIKEKSSEHQDLIYINEKHDGHELKLWVSLINSETQSNRKKQYLFCNRRPFLDKAIHANIARSMEHFCLINDLGDYFFYLDVEPSLVDVNVHPSKTQLKFQENSLIHSIISGGIKKTIKQSSITIPRLDHSKNSSNWSTSQLSRDCSPTNPKYIALSEKHLLVDSGNNQIYILHGEKALGNYLAQHFQHSKSFTTMPLMVGIPVENVSNENSKKPLELLSSLGFESDFLSQKTLLIRTIPDFISNLPYQHFIPSLVKFIFKRSKDNDFIKERFLSELTEGKGLDISTKLEDFLPLATWSIEQNTHSSLNPIFRINLNDMNLLASLFN